MMTICDVRYFDVNRLLLVAKMVTAAVGLQCYRKLDE